MHRETFEEDYEFNVMKTENGGYSVYLPHQCDYWEIIGADMKIQGEEGKPDLTIMTDNYPNLPKNKDLAVKQMELFVKRANEALEKLKNLPA